MNLQEYQAWTVTRSFYKGAGEKDVGELIYLALAMSSEVGELGNHIKKLHRDGDSQELRKAVLAEIGDVMWYAARLCEACDASLEDIMDYNYNKIEDRFSRNVQSGSGDNR